MSYTLEYWVPICCLGLWSIQTDLTLCSCQYASVSNGHWAIENKTLKIKSLIALDRFALWSKANTPVRSRDCDSLSFSTLNKKKKEKNPNPHMSDISSLRLSAVQIPACLQIPSKSKVPFNLLKKLLISFTFSLIWC